MTRNKQIIIISRDFDSVSPTADLFRRCGYSVWLSLDTRGALRRMTFLRPSLLISELAMPDIDGIDLCLRARRAFGPECMPIVLIGDLASSSPIVADARRSGANKYLQKPFAPPELYDLGLGLIRISTEFSFRTECTTAEKGALTTFRLLSPTALMN